MHQLTHIWELSKPEEMTWSRSVMFYFTLLKVNFHGKESLQGPKKKSMKRSETKSFQLKLNSFARTFLKKLVYI